MERGDTKLITEAAITKVFDFKDGSPLDPEYNIRLNYALSYITKKRTENALALLSIYNNLICIQRTLAGASELYGDRSKEVLTKYLQTLMGADITSSTETTNSSEEQTIKHFKEIYNKLYGTGYDQSFDHDTNSPEID